MSPTHFRKTVQAAVLASSLALTASVVRKPHVDVELERNFVQTKTSEVLQPKKISARDILIEELQPKLKSYPIVRGDTPAALASKHGLSLDEFITLNQLFKAPSFIRNKKTPILRIGELYYVPEDVSAIRPFFAKMHRIEKSEKVWSVIEWGGNFKKIHAISRETFFPKEPECLGMGEVLSSMLTMQQDEFDPLLPVIVDPRNEKTASCANLIKNTFIQTCNLKYYTPKQKKMLLTSDLHAWILVKKLRDEFGFKQSFADLMQAFDIKSFHSFNPIVDVEKRGKYEERMNELYFYLRDSAPQGTIVPMYFQWSQSKSAVMWVYQAKDPHLNTHQTMLAGNIDWKIQASEIPRVQDGKRIPFWFDISRVSAEVTSLAEEREKIEVQLKSAKTALIDSLNPSKNPSIVQKIDHIPALLEIAFQDRKIINYLAFLPSDQRQKIPVWVYSETGIQVPIFIDYLRSKIRNELIEGTLTVDILRSYVAWYTFKSGDIPLFQSYLEHASVLAARRKELAFLLDSDNWQIRLENFWSTLFSNPQVKKSFLAFIQIIDRKKEVTKKLSEAQVKMSGSNDIVRSSVDMMIDFIAGRADFRSSFLPHFRSTVLTGMKRYPQMIELYVNGVKLDFEEELKAFNAWKPKTLIRPSDVIRLTWPMMLDGEIQPTSDHPERRERMNARTRFFYEFATTIYLPTEVLTPDETTLPERSEIIALQSGMQQKYLYSLRKGDTLASVLKKRIMRYENISETDPQKTLKVAEHFAWQLRALKMDGFLQTESEFNPGAVNENRIIPYYDVRTVPEIWKKYLSDRKMAELEYERDISLSYLKLVTIDGAGIDSKRKLFSEIRERVLASNNRLEQFPILRDMEYFNEFQYELFMKRFFEKSLNDSGVEDSLAFFRDIRPNRSFYIRYEDLAEIVSEISDATALETPTLYPLDAKIIEAVITNKHTASLVKNILVTESYPTEWWTGIRKILKRIWGRSKGDYQLRFVELTDNPAFVREDALYILWKNGKESKIEWPTLQHLREATESVFQDEVAVLARQNLSATAYETFKKESRLLLELQVQLKKHTLSPEEMKWVIAKMMKLVRLDTGDGSNIVGKVFTTSLMQAKILLHYRKTSYWLEQMEIPFDLLANSEEERAKYERTVALVNNLSEEKVLLALLENMIIRLARDSAGFVIETRDVFAKPKNPVKKLYQEIAGQIYYDRSLFFSHYMEYLHAMQYDIKMSELALITHPSEEESQKITRKRALLSHLENYDRIFRDSRNFNASAFAFIKDPLTKSFLQKAKLPWTPFPTQSEILSTDPFQASIFNYVWKMDRRIKKEKRVVVN
jgi:hypothetical protein